MEEEPTEEVELTRKENVKKHLRENRKAYIVGGISLVVGAILGAVLTKKYGVAKKVIMAMGDNLIVNNIEGKHPVLCQTISMYGNPLGRPGKQVIDTATGKIFQSETLAARFAEVSTSLMSDHLNGKTDHIKGNIFKFVEFAE